MAYGPRRTVLDKLLVDAAAEAGAEVREGFSGVRGRGRRGQAVTAHARVVVGADGRHSAVARAVGPEQYHERPPLLCGYYSYWSGLPMDGRFETWVRPDRGFAAWPTHDGLTLVIGGWPYAELEANRDDIEGNFLAMLELAPAFAERVRAATREERFVGTAVPNYFRRPYGPGWALAGDAGYRLLAGVPRPSGRG
jgi:flavin-dependent dehydrogenase